MYWDKRPSVIMVMMLMRVGVQFSRGVPVFVDVNQVRAGEKFGVLEYGSGRTAGGKGAVVENVGFVGDVLQRFQVVGGEDDGLAGAAPIDQEIDDLALAAGVERGGGFVEQQDLGIDHQNAGE